jgi:hypothetical protein
MNIQLRPLFEIKVDVDGPLHLIGALPQGFTRRVVNVTGGRFEGDRLKGLVLPGGGDSVMERPDGGLLLDVRLTLQTDAGELIYMTYFGRRNGSPEILQKIVRREPIPIGADYFRVVVQFECGAPALRWLNDIVAVGSGTREPNGPRYFVHEVL